MNVFIYLLHLYFSLLERPTLMNFQETIDSYFFGRSIYAENKFLRPSYIRLVCNSKVEIVGQQTTQVESKGYLT